MKIIQNKTPKMLDIEKEHNKNIEEVLRVKFVDENKSLTKICKEVGISYVTLIDWLELSGVYSRNLGIEE